MNLKEQAAQLRASRAERAEKWKQSNKARQAREAREKYKLIPSGMKWSRIFCLSTILMNERGIGGQDAFDLAQIEVENEDKAAAPQPELLQEAQP